MTNRTFTMIKPTAVKKGFIGPIIAKIAEGGFKIIAAKMTKLSKSEAQKFYEIHKDRPFYDELCNFMSSGEIFAMVLEKDNAVQTYRDYIGATNPDDAAEDTIRNLYGTNLGQNAVHGSDSNENAEIEIKFFFSDREIF